MIGPTDLFNPLLFFFYREREGSSFLKQADCVVSYLVPSNCKYDKYTLHHFTYILLHVSDLFSHLQEELSHKRNVY
jgi:hypothetical protein